MGNEAGLPITSTSFNTFDVNKHTFYLKKILHIPHIKKNLLSVSKFVKDNQVFLEFHPRYCLVKDQCSRKVLLHGVLRNRLYVFDLPLHSSPHISHASASQSSTTPFHSMSSSKNVVQPSVSFSTNKCAYIGVNSAVEATASNLQLWHKRLGHPSLHVVQTIFTQCNINFPLKNTPLFCDACQLEKSHKTSFYTILYMLYSSS
ncbi:hypothetical protein ACOSQ2_012590 [Xanthoceras sorbifolium]